MPDVRHITSEAELSQLAQEVLLGLSGGTMLALHGDLGAGKTTFTQALARALGVSGAVTSPTFTIAAHYQTTHPTIKTLVHLDLYRLASPAADQDPAVRETLAQADNPAYLTVVEWAERLRHWPAVPTRHIRLAHGHTPTERTVTIE